MPLHLSSWAPPSCPQPSPSCPRTSPCPLPLSFYLRTLLFGRQQEPSLPATSHSCHWPLHLSSWAPPSCPQPSPSCPRTSPCTLPPSFYSRTLLFLSSARAFPSCHFALL